MSHRRRKKFNKIIFSSNFGNLKNHTNDRTGYKNITTSFKVLIKRYYRNIHLQVQMDEEEGLNPVKTFEDKYQFLERFQENRMKMRMKHQPYQKHQSNRRNEPQFKLPKT